MAGGARAEHLPRGPGTLVAVAEPQRDTTRSDRERDEATLQRYAAELADAVERELPGWVLRSVERRLGAVPPAIQDRAAAAGLEAVRDVGSRVRQLLELDIDAQWTNPLAVLRSAVRYPTEVLEQAGAGRPARDRDAERLHPDDPYDLTPASFADISAALHEPGLVWGAAKAHVHLARRRQEGRR
jgi:hypothetical protein